jgi:hypothetical protein
MASTAIFEYSGEIDLKDIHTVLVARDIQFTKAGKLCFRALRSLAPCMISYLDLPSKLAAFLIRDVDVILTLSTWGDVTSQGCSGAEIVAADLQYSSIDKRTVACILQRDLGLDSINSISK